MTRFRIRKELNIPLDAYVLTYVAELNQNKNQMSLLDMLSEISKQRHDVYLMLVGQGKLRHQMEERAEELGIQDHVIFTGFRNDVPDVLKAADIAVPSSIREGLGLGVLECMAVGLPVVAYDNRGHRSIVEEGISGYLVTNGDYRAMAKRVCNLIDDKKAYEDLKQHGVERTRVFDICAVMKETKKLYGGLE